MKILNTKHLTLNTLVCAAIIIGVGAGCRARKPPEGGANNPKAAAARTQSETYIVDAVKGAATAQNQIAKSNGAGGAFTMIVPKNLPSVSVSVPVPPSTPSTPSDATPWVTNAKPQAAIPAAPRAQPNVVIREKVSTDAPFPTEAKAEDEALRLAQSRVKERLEALDPPVHYTPSPAVVKNEYVRKETRTVRRASPKEQERWAAEGFPGDLYVEYEVEVTADQIRELRTQERLGGVLKLFGGIAATALAGFLFLRLDDWTKGYLTSWLAFVAAALAGGVAAALLLV